jgi:hypothetical protein
MRICSSWTRPARADLPSLRPALLRPPVCSALLPDLEVYLADLLRTHERLLATVDADEWAKAEAMPSDEEIRRARNGVVGLGLPRTRQPLSDIHSERTP